MIMERENPYFHARRELMMLMESTPFDKEDGILHYYRYFMDEVTDYESFEEDVMDMLESFDSKIAHATAGCEEYEYSEAEIDEIRALKIDLMREAEKAMDFFLSFKKNLEFRDCFKQDLHMLQVMCQRLYELFLLDKTIKKHINSPLPRANFPVITSFVQKLRKEANVYPYVWNTMKRDYNMESPLQEYLEERERIHKIYLRFQ